MLAQPTDLGTREREAVIDEVLGSLAGLDVIDIGCGEGELARALAERGARVCGVDPFMDDIPRAAHGEGTFALVRAGADALPFAAHSFDVAVFMFSLHHVHAAALAQALAQARRVLRPDGRLYVAEPLAQGPAQYVMELFHDETAVRAAAQAALRAHAPALFASTRTYVYREPRTFENFEIYAQRMIANIRFNSDFTAEDVRAPAVRARFDEMFAAHGGRFDTPVRVDLFAG